MIPLGRLLAITGLGLITAFSWWLYRQVATDPAPRRADIARNAPDYYFDDFALTAMNTQGTPRHTLAAKRLAHFEATDLTEVETPDVFIFNADAPPWHIRAAHGRVTQAGRQVHLTGAVNIERAAAANVRPVRLETRDLRVDADREYVETDQAISFVSAGTSAKAVGMRGFLGEGRVELLSQVRGVHAP